MVYPRFRFVDKISKPQDIRVVRDYVISQIGDEWRIVGGNFAFSFVYIDFPEVYFTCDSIHGALLILEKYMGHMWMVDKGLMERAGNDNLL